MANLYSLPSSLSASGSRDVLIVDDIAANLLSLQATLSDIAGEIVCASSGAEALRILLTRSFGLIILDFLLPDMNGLETAQLVRARERSRRIPIIFLTGYSYEELNAMHAVDFPLDAADFLLKPVLPDALRAKVATFLNS